MKSIFLSHVSEDASLATMLADLICRCSLRQISVWHSSDNSGGGGLSAGARWAEEITRKLDEAELVIALVTPASIKSSWLYFECGYGAARANKEVVPVRWGLSSINDVPAPLNLYQIFDCSSYRSATDMMGKLFDSLDIYFDSELISPAIKMFMQSTEAQLSALKVDHSDEISNDHLSERLINYLDNKFLMLVNSVNNIKQKDDNESLTKLNRFPYELCIILNLYNINQEIRLSIEPNWSMQDVLDDIFIRITSIINPIPPIILPIPVPPIPECSYLSKWILVDPISSQKLIIKDIANKVPAQFLMPPGSVWEVKILDIPYTPE